MFKTHRTYDLTTGVKNKSIAVFNDNKSVKVLLHKTVVVDFTNGVLTLNSGGWDTPSTRIVMNTALSTLLDDSVCLFRKKGITYIQIEGQEKKFQDGMKIYSNK